MKFKLVDYFNGGTTYYSDQTPFVINYRGLVSAVKEVTDSAGRIYFEPISAGLDMSHLELVEDKKSDVL